MGDGFVERLDRVVAKGVHLFSFLAALRAAGSLKAVRHSFGVRSDFALFGQGKEV